MNPSGYCLCGCGAKTRIASRNDTVNGRVKGQPLDYVHGHYVRWAGPEYRVASSGCWIWLRSMSHQGYGVKHVGAGQYRQAHRLMYEALVGRIPDGLQLDHLCRNRACVNPGHLEPVTQSENILRGVSPAAQHARSTSCKNGHQWNDENTRIGRGRRYCRACERERRRARRVASS